MTDNNQKWVLPEDPDERRVFDSMAATLGGPLRVVANALALMSRQQPPEGSLSRMLAIYSNECLRADSQLNPQPAASDETVRLPMDQVRWN